MIVGPHSYLSYWLVRDSNVRAHLYAMPMYVCINGVYAGMVVATRAPDRKVFFSPHTVEAKSWFFAEAPPRNEGVAALQHFRETPAYVQHNFVYTNTDGWFFSPYERSTAEALFRRVGQYIEGTVRGFVRQ